MRNLYRSNRLYTHRFFREINPGAYQTTWIIMPTTRPIRLCDGQTLSTKEGTQLLRNLVHLILQLQYHPGSNHLDEESRIDKALEAFAAQYSQ